MRANMERGNGRNSLYAGQHNRGLVLQLIATGTCQTRIEISQKTGLMKSTLTNIISEFIQKKIVVETEITETKSCGRNPIRLEISPEAPKVTGLLIFRDRIEAVLCDLTMKTIRSECISFNHLTEAELLLDCFKAIDHVQADEKNILGIGVASIGPLDIENGIILNPPEFFGIKNVSIRREIEEHYRMPVVFEHDNNCAALAEKLYGISRAAEDIIFLGVSNGIGSGLILGGEIYHDRRGLGSEMGHVSIHGDGLPCPCGSRGCLWMYASTPVMMKQFRETTGLDLTYREFCRLPQAKSTVSEMLENISTALISMCNVIQPEMIVLGHDCIDWTDEQIGWLEQRINERQIANDGYHIPVRKAFFGKEALVIGGACIIAQKLFTGELITRL